MRPIKTVALIFERARAASKCVQQTHFYHTLFPLHCSLILEPCQEIFQCHFNENAVFAKIVQIFTKLWKLQGEYFAELNVQTK